LVAIENDRYFGQTDGETDRQTYIHSSECISVHTNVKTTQIVQNIPSVDRLAIMYMYKTANINIYKWQFIQILAAISDE